MLLITTRTNKANLVLCTAFAAAAVAVVALEGYITSVDVWFAIFGGSVFVGALFSSARFLSTKRWLALVSVSGGMGLLTQHIGVSVGAWHYTNPAGTYVFVFFAFGLGSLWNYAVATLLASYALPRKLHHPAAGPVLVGVTLLASIALYATGYLSHPLFLAYYLLLFAFAALFTSFARTTTVIALVAAAWGFGLIAETLGSHSGLWQFSTKTGLPPVWLLLVSWPVEVIFHFGLSALLVRELPDPPHLRSRESKFYSLMPVHPMAVRPDNQRVVIRRGGEDRFALLSQVIDATGFFDGLDRAHAASGKPKDEYRIAVKPNFMFMYSRADHSTYTDPALVEFLIDRIVERGYTDVTIVEAQSCYGNEYMNRDVVSVARHLGYTQKNYKVADLTLEQEPHKYPKPLGKHMVGRTWRDADYRISFCKNKTHTWAAYTLTIKNIYGALPLQNKLLEYHNRREIYTPTIASLIDFPVHFGFVDAWYSADGPFGIFADREPNATRTILGGPNLVAVDWAGARLMGLDPLVSRYMQIAVQCFGTPSPVVDGDTTPYAPWVNVADATMNSVDASEELYGFTNVAFALMSRMDGVFPRRPHGLPWRVMRMVLLPIRNRIFVDPLGVSGQPDPRLK